MLFATQPFTSILVCSNIEHFKYCWTWDKGKVGGFTSAKLRPLKLFEDICVFSNGNIANCSKNNMPYYPQGLIEVNKISRSSTDKSPTGYARPSQTKYYFQKYTNYPKQLIKFPLDKDRVHPTQKPIALLEYLIKTYTKESEVILDNCAGSMSTVIACINTNRDYIAIEKDDNYFNIGLDRVQNHYASINLERDI